MKTISEIIQRRKTIDNIAKLYGLRRRWFGIETTNQLLRRIARAAFAKVTVK